MPDDVTKLLADARAGDGKAAERLFPVVYDRLRAIAGRLLDSERGDHTLQATALVHEAYLKLVDQQAASIQDRSHFMSVAATAMRRILVDHARTRGRAKRGGGRLSVTLDEATAAIEERAVDLVALDEALGRLEVIDEQQARIVELRFFGGLTIEETAEAVSVSVRTVNRDWTMARAWLRGELGA
jgi:RNA polymerase sigma factor (TIGR02999 family)